MDTYLYIHLLIYIYILLSLSLCVRELNQDGRNIEKHLEFGARYRRLATITDVSFRRGFLTNKTMLFAGAIKFQRLS